MRYTYIFLAAITNCLLFRSGVVNAAQPQDTLVGPRQIQNPTIQNITVRRSQIDLERTEEVMRQLEQRKQAELKTSVPQSRTAKPNPLETIRKPSIEVDPLLAEYSHIGCTPRANFPDTFSLTILERYYQAPPPAFTEKTPLPLEEWRAMGFHRPAGYPSSIILFLMCGLFLLAFIKYNFGKNLSGTFQSFISYRQSQRMLEERRESDRHAAFLSNILFTLIAGIFISLALPFFGVSLLWENYTLSVLFFSLATGWLYFLKSLIWRALGVIFLVQSLVKTYIYNMYLFNRNIGLMIFPLVALIPYVNATIMPYIVYIVIAVVVLSYILKFWRFFEIIHAQNVSVFYFLLYLCTLEILPLLLLVKGCKVLNEFNLFL